MEDDRPVVGGLDPRDRRGRTIAELGHSVDDVVVGAVLSGEIGRSDALEGVGDVVGGDLPRGGKVTPSLSVKVQVRPSLETSGTAAARSGTSHFLGSLDVAVAEQGPDEQVRVEADRVEVVLAGRIERVREIEPFLDADPIDAARLGARLLGLARLGSPGLGGARVLRRRASRCRLGRAAAAARCESGDQTKHG